MSDSLVRNDATLSELLTARARGASDRRLALDSALGVLAACALAWWRPMAWVPLLGAALCFAAFGAWGIAMRELGEPASVHASGTVHALHALRGAAVVTGAAGVALLLLGGLGTLLGTWIS